MARDKRADVVCIGGGASSTFFARGLVSGARRRGVKRGWTVKIVEPREHIGVGPAWDEDPKNILMSSNMHRHTLQIYGALRPNGDFDLETPTKLMIDDKDGGGQAYVPRHEVGERLIKLTKELDVAAFLGDVRIAHVRASATEVVRENRGWRVHLSTGESIWARCVVLALGLLSVDRYPHLAGIPGYHADSWNPGTLLGKIRRSDRVAIIGCGPTAMDWAFRLKRVHLRKPLVMASPTGRLPAVRPLVRSATKHSHYSREQLKNRFDKWGPFEPRIIDELVIGVLAEAGANRAEVDKYMAMADAGGRVLMDRTMKISERPQRFFDGLKVIDEIAPTIWRLSSPAGREHIKENWAKLHATFSFAIPPHNAREILTNIESGRIITTGGLGDVTHRDGAFQLQLGKESQLAPERAVDFVINATGFVGALADSTNALVRNLAADGTIVEGPHGGIAMEYETGQVVNADGDPVEGLFAVGGTLSRSAVYMVNSLIDTSEHGVLVGQACAITLLTEHPVDRKPRRERVKA